MRAVIIANGIIEGFRPAIFPDDIIIAVDGGLRHCLELKLRPHTLIGDMDSLSPEEIEAVTRSGIPISRYPARKDHTDLELALQTARSLGADDIVLLGALGARWDMTLANVMLLAAPELAGCQVRILDGTQEISLVRGGETHRFEGNAGDLLSLIPLKDDRQKCLRYRPGVSAERRNPLFQRNPGDQQCVLQSDGNRLSGRRAFALRRSAFCRRPRL